MARVLLKTSPRSWYCAGTDEGSGEVEMEGEVADDGHAADWRHEVWHSELHPVMRPRLQSTWGLCLRIQSLPNTRGTCHDLRTRKPSPPGGSLR